MLSSEARSGFARIVKMFHSMSAALATGIAAVGAITAAALVGGVTVLLSGVPAVKAEPQIKAATYQALAKGKRLPVVAKGTACSELGCPNYEAVCQFDMRRPTGEFRAVRVIALR
jgi:hypothetical protein